MVAALPAYLQDFTRFAYLTGWRKGEIISLKWTDADRDAGAIRLRPEAAKTGRGRTVILEGDLADLIDRRWQAPLLEKDGNLRVAELGFHRDGEHMPAVDLLFIDPARRVEGAGDLGGVHERGRIGHWLEFV